MAIQRLFLVSVILLVAGCGVKGLPVAPEQASPPGAAPVLNCSIYDPTCDREDPSYVPQGKSGKYPPAKAE